MKACRLEAQFPELKGETYFSGHGVASTVKASISKAVGSLLKSPGLKHKRFTTIKMSVIVVADTAKVPQTESLAEGK